MSKEQEWFNAVESTYQSTNNKPRPTLRKRQDVSEETGSAQSLTLSKIRNSMVAASSNIQALAERRESAIDEVANAYAYLTSGELFMADVAQRVQQIHSETEPVETIEVLDVNDFFPSLGLEKFTPNCLLNPSDRRVNFLKSAQD